MNRQKDILIFMSDQHDGRAMGCAGHAVVRTPNLDQLAADGTMFECAYTPCPLCVPARMSFLSGRLPIHTGVYTNKGSLHPEMPTFLHSLALAGYETVLCGRMHFEGDDQRHGFTKRIADDITSTAIGSVVKPAERLGEFAPTLTEAGCLQVIGGGNSPTLEYDRYVIDSALKYLAVPHEKPQCIVVGTYGPHFPYVAPKNLFNYYLERSELPPTLELSVDTPYRRRIRDTEAQVVRAAQAAYWGMIEFEDACVGSVRTAWDSWLSEQNREGVFLYLSDHGDHAGDRGFYGKQSLFEASVRIPMIFAGAGICEGKRISGAVSLLDIGPTICEMVGAAGLPAVDGCSLCGALLQGEDNLERLVISEWITNPYGRGTEYGRMIRKGAWKLISYVDYPEEDHLYRPDTDSWELEDYINVEREIAAMLKQEAFRGVSAEEIVRQKNLRDEGYSVLAEFNRARGKTDTEIWSGSEKCCQLPDGYIATKNPLPPMFRKHAK